MTFLLFFSWDNSSTSWVNFKWKFYREHFFIYFVPKFYITGLHYTLTSTFAILLISHSSEQDISSNFFHWSYKKKTRKKNHYHNIENLFKSSKLLLKSIVFGDPLFVPRSPLGNHCPNLMPNNNSFFFLSLKKTGQTSDMRQMVNRWYCKRIIDEYNSPR